MSTVTLDLNVFDDQGNMTGETRTVSLSVEALQDIIDHAVQISIIPPSSDEFDDVMGELVEAIEVYDIAPSAPSSAPSS